MGAVHERDTLALPGVADSPVGAFGTVAGGGNGAVGVADSTTDAVLDPTELTALTRKLYSVPFARPVTVVAVLVLVLSLNVLHEVALAVLYCMV